MRRLLCYSSGLPQLESCTILTCGSCGMRSFDCSQLDIFHVLNQPKMKSLRFSAGVSDQHVLALQCSSRWPLDAPEDPTFKLTTGRDFVIDRANLGFWESQDILPRANFKSFIWKRRARTCITPPAHGHFCCNHISAAQIEDLLKLLHRQLKSLFLSGASSSFCWADGTVLGSLIGFDKLKTIVIDACLLLGHHVCPEFSQLRRKDMKKDQSRQKAIDPVTLGALMPASVERLGLHVSQEELGQNLFYCQQIIRGSLNQKRRLSQLHEIVLIETSDFFYQCICRKCYPRSKAHGEWTTSPVMEADIRKMFLDCSAAQIHLVYM